MHLRPRRHPAALRADGGGGMNEDLRYCPFCHADLRGKPIPKKSQKAYGGKKYFSRLIGIYNMTTDRTERWRCPDCQKEWPRFKH